MKKIELLNILFLLIICALFSYGIFVKNNPDTQLRQNLINSFYSSNAEIARNNYRALKMLGSDNIDRQLRKALAGSNINIKMSAVEFMAIAGGQENFASISGLADDSNVKISLIAIKNLGRFETYKIKSKILSLISIDNKIKQLAAISVIEKGKLSSFKDDLVKLKKEIKEKEVKDKLNKVIKGFNGTKTHKVNYDQYDDY